MGTDLIPPKPIRLELSQFPPQPWAKSLVGAINQFAQQVVAAFKIAAPTDKLLDFKTGTTPADSFPIVFPVEQAPGALVVAQVVKGDAWTAAVVPRWSIVTSNGRLSVSVDFITGLAADTSYSIRLRYS